MATAEEQRAARHAQLMDAAALVDVLDVAGAIIANPARQAPAASVAQVTALALALEQAWALALEGEVLAWGMAQRAVGRAEDQQEWTRRIEEQAARIRTRMAAMRGETNTDTNTAKQETDDGSAD